eukprot:Skav221916  [mRNA]  locus=scaffold3084:135765:137671:- [translate_table: standard]
MFPACIRQVVDDTLSQSHESIAKERTAELRRWATLVNDLKSRECQRRFTMSDRRNEVLKDKKLALFEQLVSESNHLDKNRIEDFTSGFDLTGALPKSGIFNHYLRPAKVSCDNLRTCAAISRESVLQTVRSSGEPDLDKDHIRIHVDASFEPGGYSGIGGLCVNSDGSAISFFSEEVPPDLLHLVERGSKETIVLELEMVAILVAATVWRDILHSTRAVIFTDNEPVRKSLIRGHSQNYLVSSLMEAFYFIEEEVRCQVWLERVPSQSNPADEPSRMECSTLLGCTARLRVDVMDIWVKSAQTAGGDSAAKD